MKILILVLTIYIATSTTVTAGVETHREGGDPEIAASKVAAPGRFVPFTWLYVKADLENAQAYIRWATEQERATYRFEIEHSIDGEKFYRIGIVSAADDSTGSNVYSWQNAPAPGLNYYRIKEVDMHGKCTYSQTVMLLSRKGLATTIAVPSLVGYTYTLILPEPANQSTISVINAAGEPVMKMSIPEMSTQQTLDLGRCPSGVYFVQLRGKSGTEMIRVIRKQDYLYSRAGGSQ